MSTNRTPGEWWKSPFSGGNVDCVETALLDEDTVGIRDTENPDVVVRVPRDSMVAFVKGVKAGDFDDLL